jgi:hypothetical protein
MKRSHLITAAVLAAGLLAPSPGPVALGGAVWTR